MKNIIITGTSRGIGFELAKKFAENNYQVLAVSRNVKPLDDYHHQNITTLSVDISIVEEIKKITAFVTSNWSDVAIVIHNAGLLINKPFDKLTNEDFINVYNVNVFGVAEITRQLIPFMSTGSHVLTISSMGGIQGSLKFPGLAAYSSAKGAVITLSEVLAEEYKESGIAFNVLAIGAVQTEMLTEVFPGYKAPLSASEMADYIYHFSLTGNRYHNGKVFQVSNSIP